jgi:hypothetical protein
MALIQWGRGEDSTTHHLFYSPVCGRATGSVGKRRRPAALLPDLEVEDKGWDGPGGPQLLLGQCEGGRAEVG